MQIAVERKGGNSFDVREISTAEIDAAKGGGFFEEVTTEKVGSTTYSWVADGADLFKVASSSFVSALNKWGNAKLSSFNAVDGIMVDQPTVDRFDVLVIDQVANKAYLFDETQTVASAGNPSTLSGDLIADYQDGGDFLEG
jgi:hypothetical protein